MRGLLLVRPIAIVNNSVAGNVWIHTASQTTWTTNAIAPRERSVNGANAIIFASPGSVSQMKIVENANFVLGMATSVSIGRIRNIMMTATMILNAQTALYARPTNAVFTNAFRTIQAPLAVT